MAVYKGNKSGKPASFGGRKGSTPKSIKTDPKNPGKQQLANVKDAAAASSGAKPKKPSTIVTDPKNYNKQQLANIKQLASSKFGQGDNPYGKGSK